MRPPAPSRLARALVLVALSLAATLGAAWAAPDDAAVADLKKALARATDPEARVAAVRALAAAPSVEAAKLLARLSVDAALDAPTRDAAEAVLEGFTRPEVVLWAGEAVKPRSPQAEREPRVRVAVCGLLAARAVADADAGLLLLPALDDPDGTVQAAAVRGLARVRRPVVVDALVRLAGRATGRVQGDAVGALRGLTGQDLDSGPAFVAWWAAAHEGYALPAPGAAPGAAPEDPGRLRTVTRLDAADGGHTLYRHIDSSAVLFVVDNSFSMQVRVTTSDGAKPSRLDYVKQGLVAAIEAQLHEHDRFNVVVFSDAPRPWRPALTAATAANKKKAEAWVQALALEGETNISDTLELCFHHPDVDTIYFLSDGFPTKGRLTVPDEILAQVRRWNAGRGVRLNTIAFLSGDGGPFGVTEDKGMAERFLRALAGQNDGTFAVFQ